MGCVRAPKDYGNLNYFDVGAPNEDTIDSYFCRANCIVHTIDAAVVEAILTHLIDEGADVNTHYGTNLLVKDADGGYMLDITSL